MVALQSKLDDYQAKKNKGERLNQDQLVRKWFFCFIDHNVIQGIVRKYALICAK